MGIAQEENCKWCPDIAETLPHLYWLCPKGVNLWKHVKHQLDCLYSIECLINMETEIFGIHPIPRSKLSYVLDVLTTLTKYYIHCTKCKGECPNLVGLKNLIQKTMSVERSIAKENSTYGKFMGKWDRLAQT